MATRTAYTAVATEVLTAANLNKLSKGWLGYASVTSNQTGITTETTVTNLSVTPTVGANRLIRVSVTAHVSSDTSGDRWRLRVKADGTTLQDWRNTATAASSLSDTGQIVTFHAPSAGSVAYSVTLERTSGSGSLTVAAAATTPATILVEDVGPSS